jgi:hypothetical protein
MQAETVAPARRVASPLDEGSVCPESIASSQMGNCTIAESAQEVSKCLGRYACLPNEGTQRPSLDRVMIGD